MPTWKNSTISGIGHAARYPDKLMKIEQIEKKKIENGEETFPDKFIVISL